MHIKKRSIFKRRPYNYYNRKLRTPKSREFLRQELAITTCHGIPYTVDQKIHWFERTFWAVSSVSCMGLVFYLLMAQFSRFIETPIVMSVEMDYFNWNMSYPAFTLCPTPSLKMNEEALITILNETSANTSVSLESYLRSLMTANIESLEAVHTVSPEILSLVKPEEYSEMAAKLFIEFRDTSLTTKNNLPVFVETVMTELGMCHTVNSNAAKYDNPFKWNDSITAYAKNNLQLSVHERDFFTQILNYADKYKIFIHSPDESIIATSPSYTQSKRGFVSFGVIVWTTMISDELKKTPIRLRKCRLITEPINERYPIYSYGHCMLECRIQMILKLCGCVPHFYKPLDNERVCNLNELKCLVPYKKELLALSTSEKTMRKFRNVKVLPSNSRDCGCMTQCESDIYLKDDEQFISQSNIDRITISISSFPKVRVVRDIIFSFYEIVLKIGGVLNLCVGASIISLVELLVILIKLIFHHIVNIINDRV